MTGVKVSEGGLASGQPWLGQARISFARARPRLAGYWRQHWLMTVVAGLSLLPRLLAALAVRPALFTPDSFGYLAEGVHLLPGQTRPSGYPVMLLVLAPFHSLLLVTTVQHLMGVATGVLVYAVLRHWRLPACGAVLAAGPVLFDPRQLVLESAVLPDTLYTLLVTAAVAVLLTRRGPAVALAATAGFLLACAAITRGNGAAEIVAVLAVLAGQRAGWRPVTAAAAAFLIPLLAYMTVFDLVYGSFALTSSDGMFAWSRTMSFANCAVIQPPPSLRPLCPDRQPGHPGATPGWSLPPLLAARAPSAYLWASGAWWRHDRHPGINAQNNALAMRFAEDAIRAQPADYLRTVASGVMLTFLATDRSLTVRTLHFTPHPDVAHLSATAVRHLRGYAHVTSDTRAVQPWAYFLYLYQEPVYFPGLAFAAVLAIGLAGIIRARRSRGYPAALPWAVAAVGLVVPVAVHEYHYRYVITIVPVACLAAGLAFARNHRGEQEARDARG
ncbi:MAG TPA: hypothetical protein VG123_23460 [Streptosporangiaceae bacterium]|nr:hypothetical protein [Streptosporangiaceae bacterium]